jgi:hypothetical protein
MKMLTVPRRPTWSVSASTRTRVRRIAAATGVLVGVNVGARLIARFALPADTDAFQLAAWSVLVMVVVAGVVGFLWTRRRRVPLVTGDLFFVTVATTLLVALAGPVVSGSPTFDLGLLVQEIALAAGLLVVGEAGGVLLAVTLGLDPTSRAYQQQAERVKTKPRRPGTAKAKPARLGTAEAKPARPGTAKAKPGQAGARK